MVDSSWMNLETGCSGKFEVFCDYTFRPVYMSLSTYICMYVCICICMYSIYTVIYINPTAFYNTLDKLTFNGCGLFLDDGSGLICSVFCACFE